MEEDDVDVDVRLDYQSTRYAARVRRDVFTGARGVGSMQHEPWNGWG